jgi:hypothetical protein
MGWNKEEGARRNEGLSGRCRQTHGANVGQPPETKLGGPFPVYLPRVLRRNTLKSLF